MRSRILQLQDLLEKKQITSVELTEKALDCIADPLGEGAKTFIKVYKEQALAAAKASDELRQAGLKRSNLEGIPISIKDLFDYQGDITKGGSIVFNDNPPAQKTAPLIQNLINAGAIIIGRTNMTEFAFSGLGVNPHYGTPTTPWNRKQQHIAGGSSSGAAVSVSDGMSIAAIGSDTGGSIRIPATFCQLTGFKPSASRISNKGCMPLSENLDSFGPIANSVECCNIVDSILSHTPERSLKKVKASNIKLIMPTNYVWSDVDPKIEKHFKELVKYLRTVGVSIDEQEIPSFNELPHITRLGGFTCAEAWAYHKDTIKESYHLYDPRVVSRIMRGQHQSAADYIELIQARQSWIEKVSSEIYSYDAIIMPTIPILPPTIRELEDEDTYFKKNALILRNPTLINYLDGCAFSLPYHNSDNLPIGIMLATTHGKDDDLFNIAYSLEKYITNHL